MICPHCGTETPDNYNFCTSCGAPVHLTDTPGYFAGTPAPQTSPCKLDIGKLFNDTFELYKQHFGIMCLIGVIILLAPTVVGLPGGLVGVLTDENNGMNMNLPGALFVTLLCIQIFFTILQYLVQCYVYLGTMRQCLYLARGGTGFQAYLMFPPLMPFLKIVGVMLLLGCLCCICMLPGFALIGIAILMENAGAASDMGILAIAGLVLMLLGLLPMIWLSIRLYLAQFFIADQENVGVINSMQYAWRITLGNFWMLLIASMVLAILSSLGMILCCVGIIMTYAISWIGGALAYMQLTGQPNCLDYPVPQ